MQTLTHGIQKPETGDVGQPIFDALASNAQIANDHTHDGLDSAKISVGNLLRLSQAIPAANWTNPINGIYSQSVIIIGGLQLDTTIVSFRNSSGDLLNLDFDKVDNSTYQVHCNDPSLTITAVYA